MGDAIAIDPEEIADSSEGNNVINEGIIEGFQAAEGMKVRIEGIKSEIEEIDPRIEAITFELKEFRRPHTLRVLAFCL